MCASFLYVLILTQFLSLAIGSPLDSLLDPLPSLDGTQTSPDNPGLLTANAGGPEDLLLYEPGAIAIAPDSPVSLLPETDNSGTSFDGAPGGVDILAASNECYPKEQACCLGHIFSTCYYAPSAQCSSQILLCCDRIDSVSLAGVGCQSASKTIQQPFIEPQDANEAYLGAGDEALSDEDWLSSLWGF